MEPSSDNVHPPTSASPSFRSPQIHRRILPGDDGTCSTGIEDELPFDPNVIPELGVKVFYLNEFGEKCDGRKALKGLTTTP